jgi:transposase-like protein
MAFHGFIFFLILCLAWLWHLYWLRHNPLHSRKGAIHTTIQRLLKPCSPRDCPACRLTSPLSAVVEPASLPVRPWCEIKSRQGAPKRMNTQDFAFPNRKCPYFGITDAHIHALVGDGKHGHAERIQTFRCQACRTTFTARRNTPLYRLKTPSHQIAMVLSALAEGLDPSAAERVLQFEYQHLDGRSTASNSGFAGASLSPLSCYSSLCPFGGRGDTTHQANTSSDPVVRVEETSVKHDETREAFCHSG